MTGHKVVIAFSSELDLYSLGYRGGNVFEELEVGHSKEGMVCDFSRVGARYDMADESIGVNFLTQGVVSSCLTIKWNEA